MKREGGSGREIVRGTARLNNERLRFSGRNFFDSARKRERERDKREGVNDKERLMNERWEQNIWRGKRLKKYLKGDKGI